MTRTFPNTGEPFSGLHAAEAWCRQNYHACGSQQRNAPIGVHHVEDGQVVNIPKWRALTVGQAALLDGQMKPLGGSYKTGGVVLVLTGGPLA